uniref:Uncharacterized protein n=1 Tax=Chrysotila carterae TaxID=13221 RepID=A0A7S4AYG3_CHRCT|mmetsp:Transcript_5047/g.11029  ORF Transcript_5047/g.11029 Transcript_5047/m.11029 type:complete len:148 (+) Transcript_5047:178-621(+)
MQLDSFDHEKHRTLSCRRYSEAKLHTVHSLRELTRPTDSLLPPPEALKRMGVLCFQGRKAVLNRQQCVLRECERVLASRGAIRRDSHFEPMRFSRESLRVEGHFRINAVGKGLKRVRRLHEMAAGSRESSDMRLLTLTTETARCSSC